MLVLGRHSGLLLSFSWYSAVVAACYLAFFLLPCGSLKPTPNRIQKWEIGTAFSGDIPYGVVFLGMLPPVWVWCLLVFLPIFLFFVLCDDVVFHSFIHSMHASFVCNVRLDEACSWTVRVCHGF